MQIINSINAPENESPLNSSNADKSILSAVQIVEFQYSLNCQVESQL